MLLVFVCPRCGTSAVPLRKELRCPNLAVSFLFLFPNSFSFRVLVVCSKKVPQDFSTAGPGQGVLWKKNAHGRRGNWGF